MKTASGHPVGAGLKPALPGPCETVIPNIAQRSEESNRMIRAFIAVDLPEDVERALGAAAQSLRDARIEGLRAVRPQGIHLTLKFLGDVPEARVDEIGNAVSEAVAGRPQFEVSTGGPGAFPNNRRPQVLWVGIAGRVGPLMRLQAEVDAALGGLGFPAETRPFHPHLTLARLDRRMPAHAKRASLDALESAGPPAGTRIAVRSVSLVRSILGRGGARYVRLTTVSLAKGLS